MAASTPAIDPWSPPSDDVEWMHDPRARANHLAAMKRHTARLHADAVEFMAMWSSEIAGIPTERLAFEDRAATDTAELIAELVRVAHDRRQLGATVAASFKRVAVAVGVNAELLAAVVRSALDTGLAA